MSIVPALDLRPQAPATPYVPHNIEAEQALLGSVLYDNEALHLVADKVEPEHFYEPFHGRLWDSIVTAMRLGLAAEAFSVAEEFRTNTAFAELGGVRYLADLVDRAPPSFTAPQYARIIVELATRRRLIAFSDELQAAARDPGGLMISELVEQAEAGLLAVSKADPRLELQSASTVSARILAKVDDKSTPVGFLTGLAPLDLQVGPVAPGQMVIIAGRPGMGKSALATHIGLRIAAPQFWQPGDDGFDEATGLKLQPPAGFVMISGEMSEEEMAERCHSDIGHHLFGREYPSYQDIARKRVSVSQRAMMTHVHQIFGGMPVMFLKRTGLRLSTVWSVVRRQAAKWQREGIKVGGAMIDHLGLVTPDEKASGRYEKQTLVSMGTKALADELECPVWALVQLSRSVEGRDDKHATLADLRDSGSLEQDADTVLFPYRESYYADKEAEPDAGKDPLKWNSWSMRKASKTLEINVGKLRGGRAGGTAKCWMEPGWNAIRGAAPEERGMII